MASGCSQQDWEDTLATRPVKIDPRRHDAVLFDVDVVVAEATTGDALDAVTALTRKLGDSGIKTAVYSSDLNCERALRAAGFSELFTVVTDSGVLDAVSNLGAEAERLVVIENADRPMAPDLIARFALVVDIDRTPEDASGRSTADAVVGSLWEVEVQGGCSRRSLLPSALTSYGQLLGVISGRRPLLCLDFDGTLSEIVGDPDTATPAEGVGKQLTRLVELCPVAIVSGRDLGDIRNRVGIPGLWYSGSHGYELARPDGGYEQYDDAVAAIGHLQEAAAALESELKRIAGVRIERKRFAVAVHYRGAAQSDVADIIEITRRRGRAHDLRTTHGRKVVELRPDIDWDKGTALGWLRHHVGQSLRTLPIYIGDDITDEDAFDSVRSSGIGIVVRNSEDSDGPSAAQFSLNSTREVAEFLQRLGDWLEREEQSEADAWTYTFDGYDPQTEKLREALCTVGNGYIATRGAAPESKSGQIHYPGTYAAGIYNRLDDIVGGTKLANESLVNLPNWLPLTFRIDGGDWFDVDAVTLLDYRQTLDLRGAVLTRKLRFRDDEGRTSSLTQRRIVAMHVAHVAALETVILAEDWSGRVEVRSMLDGDVRNSLVERYRELASNHLEVCDKRALAENSVLLAVQTTQSRITVALAARTTVWRDAAPGSATYRIVEQEFGIGHHICTELAAGQSLLVEKVVAVATGRDVAACDPATSAERRLARQPRFAEICAEHTLAWAQLWERLAIRFDGHTDELRILRLHMLHLLQTVSGHSEDIDTGVPARGLHGEAYRGHVFWDELFIFPALNLRLPMVTRSLLRYRYRRLPEARRAAQLAGYSGAMFPWQSGSDGREESPDLHLNPRSGRWNPDPSRLAHHIGIAVAYNVWQFYQATGDLAYLIDYGAELLVEIARFWVSRTTYQPDRDRFSIRGVIGPDEFHSGYPDRPYEGIDNNAYTNVMATWVILRAIEVLERIPLPNRLDLREKLRVSTEEIAHWDHVSRRMFVPFHDGVISQFEGYEKLVELDWAGYQQRYGDIQRLDRILEAEDDDVNRYKAAKQADALMLLYLLSSDELRELLSRLGYRFAPEQIPRVVDYYLARTSHGSTLSAVVHTWVLARAHRDRAMDFFRQVLKADVADIQGGTTSEGIHLGAMAGSVDLMQRCFTGLETRSDRLVLSPYWPESLGVLDFPIRYRGHHMYVRVSGREAEISVDPRPAPAVVVECRGHLQNVQPGCTIRLSDGIQTEKSHFT
ncbi:putative glycosyl hydrolase [Mycolicibacterium mageritense]|nr:putative glycosyl hydrolase [Mycolicibacterium mageritense]